MICHFYRIERSPSLLAIGKKFILVHSKNKRKMFFFQKKKKSKTGICWIKLKFLCLWMNKIINYSVEFRFLHESHLKGVIDLIEFSMAMAP